MNVEDMTAEQVDEFRDLLRDLVDATNPKHKKEVKQKIKDAGFKVIKPTPENAPPLDRPIGAHVFLTEQMVRDLPELSEKMLGNDAIKKMKRIIAIDDMFRANNVSNAPTETTTEKDEN